MTLWWFKLLQCFKRMRSTRLPDSLPALDVEADNPTSVEAFRFSASSCKIWYNIYVAHLRWLSSWKLYISCKHRLRTWQLWLRSALVPLREEIHYRVGHNYDINYPKPISSRYQPKSSSNHSLWLHGIQGANYTSFQTMDNVMHGNQMVSIFHPGAKPQFWGVQTSEETNA